MTLDRLSSARRVVLKLGSALLRNANGAADTKRLTAMALDISDLVREGKQVVVVSSGAVALGRDALGLKGRSLRLEEKQAAAAAGQPRLMRAWEDALAPHGLPVAQALLTIDDTETRRRWLNARATLNTLLDAGAVPIVNENDTVATQELRYGDNDRLAARVAQMISADVLILLSDIDGLYDADPRANPNAAHIPEVRELTPQIVAMAGGANAHAGVGSGGMATKLEAARIAFSAGCATVIAMGDRRDKAGAPAPPLAALKDGARSTWFVPDMSPETARRQWLMGAVNPAGAFVVDTGAARALSSGKSLLPAGVTSVAGRFDRGDMTEVKTADGVVVARGLSSYSSDDAARIIGRKSSETEAVLGYKGRPALIHRDDLVLIGQRPAANTSSGASDASAGASS